MSEDIIINCPFCGRRHKIKIGDNYKCRTCARINIWKDEDYYRGEYIDTSPEVKKEEVVEEEIKDEETLNDIGVMYDYKEEE